MSKYDALWEYVRENGQPSFTLTFEEIQNIAGIPIDHSFLKYKKELTEYGYADCRRFFLQKISGYTEL